MPWFKLDDEWHGHLKVREAGNAAAGLWARCGCWSSQYLTNGFVPDMIVNEYGTKAEVARVTNAKLWVRVEGGYQIPDFLDYNPSAEQIKRERAAAAERQRRAREAASAKRHAVSHGGSHGVTEGDVTPVVTPLVTVPPTRPDPLVVTTEGTHHLQLPDETVTEDDPLVARMKAIAVRYAEVRWETAEQKQIGSPVGFKNAEYRKALEMPKCAQYARLYTEECPVDILANSLNGQNSSLKYCDEFLREKAS